MQVAAALQPQHLGKRQRRRVNYHEDNLAKKVGCAHLNSTSALS